MTSTEGNMLQSGMAWITQADYNGRSIQLKSVQRHDGTWECEYKILEIGPTRSRSVRSSHNGSFSTHEEAEAAALDEAQAEINSGGPLT